MDNKSQVETYWQALADKSGDNRSWHELRVQEQHIVITSINMLLSILQIKEK
jgi:hypothetical protein